MNWNLSAATCVLETLHLGGMNVVVSSPGSRNTPLLLGARSLKGLTQEMVLDERSAGFFALGIARATRAPVGLICTSGSALAHYLPALIEASATQVPLIVLSADRPAHLHHGGAPQTIAQDNLFGSHVRWTATAEAPTFENAPRRWRTLALQALSKSMGGQPGPVHLNLCFDDPLWDGPAERVAPGEWVPPQTLLSPAGSQTLAAKLEGVEKGLIVCGPLSSDPHGERNGRFARAVTRLSDMLGWPILAEPASGLCYGPHDKANVIDSGDVILRSETFRKSSHPDFVLRVGRLPTSKALHTWLGEAAQDRCALIDPHGEWSDPFHGSHQLISAPVTPFLEELAGCLGRQGHERRWLEHWRQANLICSDLLNKAALKGHWEGGAAHRVVQSLAEGSALVVGNSMPIRDVESFGGMLQHSISFFASRGANGIDGTCSTAMGIAISRDTDTTLLCGDLTFLHDVGGLSALLDRNPPFRIVVVDNGGGGIFHFLPIAAHPDAFEPCYLTPPATDIASVCEGLGLPTTSIGSREALDAALAVPIEKTHVIHVSIDREANVQRHKDVFRECIEAMDGLLDMGGGLHD